MGGYGSGRQGGRTTVEDCRSLDVRRFLREGWLPKTGVTSGSLHWRDEEGNEVASLGYSASPNGVLLSYTLRWREEDPEALSYTVSVVWTPCHYGGRTAWFLCPNTHCRRRVAKLYLPVYGRGKYYLCRHCYGLAYTSQRQPYHRRLLEKAWKIKRRLGGRPGDIYPFPDKPAKMRWRTYWRLRDEYDRADVLSLWAVGAVFKREEARRSRPARRRNKQ